MNSLIIELVEGKQGPFYPSTTEGIALKKAVVTEQGTKLNLPIVDLVFKDEHGNEFVATTTGAIIIGLSDAIKGVNMRNHGKENPSF